MFRLTFRTDNADADTVAWSARVRDAVPPSMLVAAYLETATLTIYVDIEPRDDPERAIRDVVDALGLGNCHVCRVVSLTVMPTTRAPAVAAQPRLTRTHPARIVSVDIAPDGRNLSVKVRHTHYERVDHVDVAETDDTVQLSAWVGRDEADPRADYATLAHTFSDVATELSRPVGERRVVYDIG